VCGKPWRPRRMADPCCAKSLIILACSRSVGPCSRLAGRWTAAFWALRVCLKRVAGEPSVICDHSVLEACSVKCATVDFDQHFTAACARGTSSARDVICRRSMSAHHRWRRSGRSSDRLGLRAKRAKVETRCTKRQYDGPSTGHRLLSGAHRARAEPSPRVLAPSGCDCSRRVQEWQLCAGACPGNAAGLEADQPFDVWGEPTLLQDDQ